MDNVTPPTKSFSDYINNIKTSWAFYSFKQKLQFIAIIVLVLGIPTIVSAVAVVRFYNPRAFSPITPVGTPTPPPITPVTTSTPYSGTPTPYSTFIPTPTPVIKSPTPTATATAFPISPPGSPIPLPICNIADINKDGVVNLTDRSILLSYLFRSTNPVYDLNRDGVVDGTDYSIFAKNYLQSTGTCQ